MSLTAHPNWFMACRRMRLAIGKLWVRRMVKETETRIKEARKALCLDE